jgi:two-component system, cell cycle response regulator
MSDKILIVDDLVTNRIILKVKLTAASHAVLQAGTGAEALDQAVRHRPALILLDMHLPDMSGTEVCRRLRADPALQHTPIIVISASTQRACRLGALEAGADAFLTKPLNETVLMARIRNLLRASQTDAGLRLQAETCQEFGLSEAAEAFRHPPRIALIAPDPGMARGWKAALAAHLPGDYAYLSPAQALADCTGAQPPDLFVIAADPARPSDAMRLIADLRARDGGRAAGLCLALEDTGQDPAALALDLGANDVVALPLDPQETALRMRVQLARQRRAADLRRAVQHGLELAATDPLTGLYNRRYALAHLDRIATRAAETGTQFAVMVLDLDRFKAVNDRFGHAAGDVVLVTVAARLAAALRPSDLVARVGGEEFLVALPDATLPMARAVAERLCAVIAQTPILLPDGLGAVSVTMSAGLTLGPGPDLPVPSHPGGPTRLPLGGGGDATVQAGGQAGTGPGPGTPQGSIASAGLTEPAGVAVTRAAERVLDRTWTLAASTGPTALAARSALSRADTALLAAKGEGRNQVTILTAA